MNDRDLLNAYARTRSHDAFAELVRRHAGLVHAAARRQAGGDGHLADDVTQAVFLVLARRAGTISDRATVPGWLIRTTRYAALAAAKARSRRRRHEREAAAMGLGFTATPSDAADAVADLGPLLDDALSRLPAKYRAAVTLRYLQNKSTAEVAAELGVTEVAARKRVGRGIEKLRARFARRGISTPESAIEAFLSGESAHVAPAGLVALVSSPAFGGTASAAATAAATSKALAAAKVKFFAAAAAVVVAAGVAIPVVHYWWRDRDFIPVPVVTAAASPAVAVTGPVRAADPVPTTAPADVLVRFTGADFSGGATPAYRTGVEVDGRRGVVPVAYIRSVGPNPTQGSRRLGVSADALRGKRVRLSVFARAVGVQDWAGLQVTVVDAHNRILADDDMGGRPIHGTTEWQPYHIVVDVPREAAVVVLGANLRGVGELWTDDFILEAVPADTPTTDDTNWHLWSPRAAHYKAALDPGNPRGGHATLCVSSTTAPAGSWVNYDRYDRAPDKYLGRRIRMTAWVKSDHMNSTAGLLIRVLGAGGRELAGEGQRGKRPVRGTSDWTLIEATADVPKNAQAICTGITMNGRGRLWFDDVRYEVVDGPAGAADDAGQAVSK